MHVHQHLYGLYDASFVVVVITTRTNPTLSPKNGNTFFQQSICESVSLCSTILNLDACALKNDQWLNFFGSFQIFWKCKLDYRSDISSVTMCVKRNCAFCMQDNTRKQCFGQKVDQKNPKETDRITSWLHDDPVCQAVAVKSKTVWALVLQFLHRESNILLCDWLSSSHSR